MSLWRVAISCLALSKEAVRFYILGCVKAIFIVFFKDIVPRGLDIKMSIGIVRS